MIKEKQKSLTTQTGNKMEKNILVTPRSLSKGDHPALNILYDAGLNPVFPSPGRQPTEEELLSTITDVVGYLAGVEKVTAKVLEKADKLKVISRNGVGIDNIDIESTNKYNIKVCKAVGANARGVADLTLAHMLAISINIAHNDF